MPIIPVLILVFSFQAFACKLPSGTGIKGEETAAINAVKKKTRAQHVKVKADNGRWLVRTTKPSCLEFVVESQRHPDCKVTAEILKERPCP